MHCLTHNENVYYNIEKYFKMCDLNHLILDAPCMWVLGCIDQDKQFKPPTQMVHHAISR